VNDDQTQPPDDEVEEIELGDAGELFGLKSFEQPADELGLSLEELSETYAEMISGGGDPYDESASEDDSSEAKSFPRVVIEEPEDPVEISPRSILEAMLFVGHPENESLSARAVAALMRGVRPEEVDELVVELNEVYDDEQRPYRIVSEGSGYRLQLTSDFASLRDRFYGQVKSARLTQAAVDALAIVAYNQPITRREVDQLRGKPSGGVLSQLVRRELLELRRLDEKPRRAVYLTTERFLDLFGLDAIEGLPQSQDLDREL
jgi:segregation and condensation protein B